jgi:hypothetical protein
MLFQSATINQQVHFTNRKKGMLCIAISRLALPTARIGQSARYRALPWETGDSCSTAICCGNWECQLSCSRGNPRLMPEVGSCTTFSKDRGRQAPHKFSSPQSENGGSSPSQSSTSCQSSYAVSKIPLGVRHHQVLMQIVTSSLGSVQFLLFILFIWFLRLLALRPLLAYCASLVW